MTVCGELTEADCLKAIENYRDQLVFQEVRDVIPQVKANNQMITQCETDYLIPLDADMILHEGFAERIVSGVKRMDADPKCHTVLHSLWDTLTEQKIYALKLLRTSIMQEHLFAETATPDVEHYTRLQDQGYHSINLFDEPTIGKHVVKGAHFCYHKYRDVYQTMRSHKRVWCDGVAVGQSIRDCAYNHYQFFINKYNDTDDQDYLYCIIGMMDGITSELEHKSKCLDKPIELSPDLASHYFVEWYLKNEMSEKLELP
tara:strand:- start:16738 stop:17511 length:774 start_codon:yes stop_codon:yes gene_type:complete